MRRALSTHSGHLSRQGLTFPSQQAPAKQVPIRSGGLMKRVDLHIHTVRTARDPAFTYSLDTFKRYVGEAALDAVAVTNHDVFDLSQYRAISSAISAIVFPGIEVSLDDCHVLLIASPNDADDFAVRCQNVTSKIKTVSDSLPAKDLRVIFGDLGRYLVIPHYTKHPAVSVETLAYLGADVTAGEVESPKKFIQLYKDPLKPTPVLFSDARMSTKLDRLPTRNTFIDCGEITLASLRACLKDKAKVALT